MFDKKDSLLPQTVIEEQQFFERQNNLLQEGIWEPPSVSKNNFTQKSRQLDEDGYPIPPIEVDEWGIPVNFNNDFEYNNYIPYPDIKEDNPWEDDPHPDQDKFIKAPDYNANNIVVLDSKTIHKYLK